MTWVLFVLLAAVILYAGNALTHRADSIAERTDAGRTWIGLVLVAAVTSLPELFTGLGASAIYRTPDIAVGNILGGNMVTLMFIVLIDALGGKSPFTFQFRQSYLLATAFGAALMALVGTGIEAGARFPAAGWVGLPSLLLIPVYLFAMRYLHRVEKRGKYLVVESEVPLARPGPRVRRLSVRIHRVYWWFGAYAAAIVAAALLLPQVGASLAKETGLGLTFVGTLLIAMTTSLPEIAVTLAAVRMERTDLALGNIFGSNLFNLAILGLDDLWYSPGLLLQDASSRHLVSVFANFLMYAVIALWVARPRVVGRRMLRLSVGSWMLIAVYVAFILLLEAQIGLG